MSLQKHIVIWSGGADSTLLLCDWAAHFAKYNRKEQLIALTVTYHAMCNKEQLKCQIRAQSEFKKFAKAKGWNIKYETVRISGTARNTGRQAFLWATQLMPYFSDGDCVGWGYTAFDDGFWHFSNEFLDILKAGNLYRRIEVDYRFPLEYL